MKIDGVPIRNKLEFDVVMLPIQVFDVGALKDEKQMSRLIVFRSFISNFNASCLES